ncbi:MAG: ATP-binding cassette domain-containing protein, partial [Pseudomonadales bacterium]|nr:ATP-binding cassette domain-containing protein [Pseudomonadales bacterium]
MAIELNEVQFRYPNQTQPILSIPNWSLADGERALIHGPSGGGKSTFLNVLSGLLAVNSGSVSILGQRIDQLSIRQKDRFRAEHIGFVFQQF